MVFNTALSGIQASSKALDVMGHNIANAATPGFKSSRAEFQDVYSLGSYGGSQNIVGSGVRLSRVQQNFGQGNVVGTGNSLDLAINGKGFFVLNDQGTRVYSRAGAFDSDENGFIVNSARQRLVGKLADSNGTITNTLGDLQINTSNITPKSSSLLDISANLSAKTDIVAPSLNWVGGATPSQDSYTHTTSTNVYDSLGNLHTVSMYFIKADANAASGAPNASSPPGTLNQWYVAYQIDNQDVPALSGTDNTSNLFRMNFNSDGTFSDVLDTSNTSLPNQICPLSLSLNNGALPLNLNVAVNKITQFGGDFSVLGLNPDGYAAGKLEKLYIGKDGTLFGAYSNGQSRAMGQVLLADFPSLGGLQSLGGSVWGETSDSGQPLLNNAGAGSLGIIDSASLEESNVDLTGELVGLISAQRNFQANAKTIQTADAMAQTIINIG